MEPILNLILIVISHVKILGKICYVGANEEVLAISIYEGKVVAHLSDTEYLHGPVTVLAQGKSRSVLAAGHNDGSVLIYSPESFELKQRFSLHSSSVTYLCFDKEVLIQSTIGIYSI